MSTHLDTADALPTRSGGNMNAIWKRMAWKECNELLPIAAVVLAIAGLCFYVTCLTSRGNYFSAGALRTCLYAFLTIQAATLAITGFATESEHRTIGMLQSLPVHPRVIGRIKLAVGLAMTILAAILIRLLFAGVLTAAGAGFGRVGGVLPMLILVSTAVAVYLFSAFVSVNAGSLPRALFCAAMALVPLVIAVQVNESAVESFLKEHFWTPVALMLLFGLVVAGLTYQSIVAWVEGKSWLTSLGGGVSSFQSGQRFDVSEHENTASIALAKSSERSSGPARFWPVYGRVVWQTWRQSRVALIISALLCVVCVSLVCFSFFEFHRYDHAYYNNRFPWVPETRLMLAIAFCSSVIAGASSSLFWPDHKNGNVRIFQQQREHANAYWCGKLTLWLGLTVAVAILIYALAMLYLHNLPAHKQPGNLEVVLQSVALLPLFALLVALGCGQFSSILIRNPIISMVSALALSALAAGGLIYLAAMRESLLWYALPVIGFLFAASWWRCKDWLSSRNRWFHLAKPILLFLLGTTVAMGLMINHRANEIAETPTSYEFLMEQGRFSLLKPEGEQETAEMYRAASKMLAAEDVNFEPLRFSKADEETAAFAKKHQAAIDLIIKAAKRPWCSSIFDGERIVVDSKLSRKQKKDLLGAKTRDLWNVQYLMTCQAVNMIKNGEHDEALTAILAWDRLIQRGAGAPVTTGMNRLSRLLVDWAEMPNQTPERIRAAIAQLDGPPLGINFQENNREPSSENVSFLYRHRRMEGQLFRIQREMQLGAADEFSGLPWWDEQRRKRISDAINVEVLEAAMRAAPVENGQKYLQHSLSTRFSRLIREPLVFNYRDDPFFLYWLKREQNTLRYTMVRMALAAWHLEHGTYPQRLNELAGCFNNGLPKTFKEGRNFGWFPDGMGVTLFHMAEIRNGELAAPILLPIALEEIEDLGPIKFFDTKTKEFVDEETATTIKGVKLDGAIDHWDLALLKGTELRHKDDAKE